MDFPQQIEETLVERPIATFDVVMESPLYINMEQKTKAGFNGINDKMNSSMNSPLDDTTPSDSGVQMLDSELEASDLMVESITSQNGFDFEDSKTAHTEKRVQVLPAQIQELIPLKVEHTTPPVDTNSNITTANTGENVDEMTASACSTFDTTENIVYRRKLRKASAATAKAPKKRVSFHEDILKNTRTDNIHIEHGFITYKNGRKMPTNLVAGSGRYSWCSEGQAEPGAVGGGGRHAELCGGEHSPDGEEQIGEDGTNNGRRRRRIVYRNACSDVLDYGNSDVYDTNEPHALQYDNSGVFEYLPKRNAATGAEHQDNVAAEQTFYRCSCSSSNSSLDSDENDKNSNEQQKKCPTYAGGQPKSSSCDCVMSNANNNFITDNCYFSEPNIDNLKDVPSPPGFKKSVWNKEKKPKSSCLKKTKYHTTNVIHEQDLSSKVKKFNVHDMNHLLDNSSKMLFGSLKSIFTMPLPERGVPEGSEDLQSVAECLSEFEQTPEHKSKAKNSVNENTVTAASPSSPVLKAKPFLSKSLDGSKAQQNVKQFVHNVDEQLRRKNVEELFVPSRQTSDETAITTNTLESKTPLQRQAEFECETMTITATNVIMTAPNTITMMTSPPQLPPPSSQFRNKFIINCESTVFEHTGVSYEAQQCTTPAVNANKLNQPINRIDAVDDDDSLVVAVAEDEISIGSNAGSLLDKETPIAQPEPDHVRSAFYSAPIAKTFSSFFRSFKDATTSTPNTKTAQRQQTTGGAGKMSTKQIESEEKRLWENYCAPKLCRKPENPMPIAAQTYATTANQPMRGTLPTATSSSTISSELSSSTSSSNAQLYKQQQLQPQQQKSATSIGSNSLVLSHELRSTMEKQSRHLPSPLKKRNSGSNNFVMQPQRYGSQTYAAASSSTPTSTAATQEQNMLSPDAFNNYNPMRNTSGRDSKSTILSEEFDDILTITTDTDKNESDIVIVDYPSESNELPTSSPSIAGTLNSAATFDYGNLLKPPSAKTSLINRFLRNVTQKKILESSMRRNNFFAQKLKTEQKLLTGQLYVRGVRGPKNYELIDDLNAEIAMEIEMSGANSPRRELTNIDSSDLPGDASRFELGIGEISIDIFNGNYLHILRDASEHLMKVFKLYTGYSREGFMTPVLVFLTDKTLYVTDLVRNRLCTKFVLAYIDLDVILLGPYGNTVLLSNSTRDMQQVLLAGGPYPADRLVANLELCARRSGSTLPAVGQLTLEHLAPLRAFVRANSSVGKNDAWMYYAVVNVPAGGCLAGGNLLTSSSSNTADKEPLGPHVKGFLMHRRIKNGLIAPTAAVRQSWSPGYFLLKAGVLYMFNDSMQKLPSWAMALAECQGARRAVKTGRPHCFEIIVRGGELLQMAAPDEYVASEWLQALLQSASGLFEMQEKHKTLGCTLIVTQNHLITLREDFTAPLRKINKTSYKLDAIAMNVKQQNVEVPYIVAGDPGSVLSSTKSTPTKANSSVNSTPTKLSQLSRSTTTSTATSNSTTTTTGNTLTSQTASNNINVQHVNTNSKVDAESTTAIDGSYSNMSSVYGKNSGLEILTCADIKDMTGIKIPSHNDTWWCILEFSCQEVRECSDDLVVFFASSAEMQRFLRLLEQLWQAKNNDLFPITVLDEDDLIAEQCTMLYMDINRSWEPLLSAALGYPL